MLVTAKAKGPLELVALLRGTLIAQGRLATNTAASPNLGVPVASPGPPVEDDFTDVQVGDRVHISGELSTVVFLVSVKSDDQNIILDNNIAAAHTADGIWRVFRGGIDPTSLAFVPFPDALEQNSYVIIYETDTFGV